MVTKKMNRRDFLKMTAAGATALSVPNMASQRAVYGD